MGPAPVVFLCVNLSTVLLGFIACQVAPPPFDMHEVGSAG